MNYYTSLRAKLPCFCNRTNVYWWEITLHLNRLSSDFQLEARPVDHKLSKLLAPKPVQPILFVRVERVATILFQFSILNTALQVFSSHFLIASKDENETSDMKYFMMSIPDDFDISLHVWPDQVHSWPSSGRSHLTFALHVLSIHRNNFSSYLTIDKMWLVS